MVPPNGTDRTKMGGDISVLIREWGGYVSKSSLQGEYFTDAGVNGASRTLKMARHENIIDIAN